MKKYFMLLAFISMGFIFPNIPNNSEEGGTTVTFTIPNEYSLPYNPAGKNPNDPVQLANFAWQEMIALNWKATYDGKKNLTRDEPDKNWNYTKAGTPDHVVWETYAHRSELRPAAPTFDVVTRDFNSIPKYTFGTSVKQATITPAPGTDMELLNCLDEDNEIGSCILFANGGNDVASLEKHNQVVYQAKINSAGLNYRKDHFKTATSISTASAKVGFQPSHPNAKLLKGKTASCDSKGLTGQGYICFPCSDKGKGTRGVIEIKTAWRKYQKGIDNLNDYFHRKAIHFPEVDDDNLTATAENDLFLLIGMHINHKTSKFPTFVIATFEHKSVRNDHYKYVSKPGGDNDYSELYKINAANDVKRNAQVSEAHGGKKSTSTAFADINEAVHTALQGSNIKANQYLRNYNLIGVQGAYSGGYGTADVQDPSFFLSNFVIETDNHLANFYGSFTKPQFGTQKVPGTQDNFFNLVTKGGKTITAGGCKGCHGVAQTEGLDMSFLMDSSKPAPTPDESFLTTSEIMTQFLTPGQINDMNNNSKLSKKQTVFLSYYEGSKKTNDREEAQVGIYTDGPKGQQNFIVLREFDKYLNKKAGYIDVDGYPKRNIIIDTYNEKNGQITLRFGEANGNTLIVGTNLIDLKNGLGKKKYLVAISKEQSPNIYKGTFILKKNKKRLGYIQLSDLSGNPVLVYEYKDKKGKITFYLYLGVKSKDEPTDFGVDVFEGSPYPH